MIQKEDIKLKGVFKMEVIRNGKIHSVHEAHNAAVVTGRNKMLDVMFHATTQITAWYLGIIDDASFTALNDADTMASHAGWIEFEDYDEDPRPEWTEGAASAGVITNASIVAFTVNAAGDVQGLFLSSDDTKGGTAGTLWATGLFAGAPVHVEIADVLRITYSVTLYT